MAVAASRPTATILGFPGDDHGPHPVRSPASILTATTSRGSPHWILRVRSSVQPGSSGSPMLDGDGDVLGILFQGAVDLPNAASAAQKQAALTGLRRDAARGSVIPAAPAAAFVQAVDATPDTTPPARQHPDLAVVRVFCLFDSKPR